MRAGMLFCSVAVAVAVSGACQSDDTRTAADVTTTTLGRAPSPTDDLEPIEGSSTSKPPATVPATSTTAARGGPAKAYEYGATDSGKTVAAGVGDTIRVSLEECGTSCGYRWEQTKAPDGNVLRLMGSQASRPESGEGFAGGNETRTFTYEATGRGTTSVVLKYFPPGDGGPEKTFTLSVRVE